MFGINYDKLAKKILDSDIKDKVVRLTASILADKIMSNKESIDKIVESLYVEEPVYNNYSSYGDSRRIPIELYIGTKVAERLVPDVYDMQKAEVLKEVSSEGVANLLRSKLEEQAKQHVLNFIAGPSNNV